MAVTLETLIAETVKTAAEVAWKYSLFPETAIRYGAISAVLRAVGTPVPSITSGGRTAEEQRDLYRRWKMGEPGIYKPARCSWHIGGYAIDVNTKSAGFPSFEYLWALMPGGRVGRVEFDDPPHFDIGRVPGVKLLGPRCAWSEGNPPA